MPLAFPHGTWVTWVDLHGGRRRSGFGQIIGSFNPGVTPSVQALTELGFDPGDFDLTRFGPGFDVVLPDLCSPIVSCPNLLGKPLLVIPDQRRINPLSRTLPSAGVDNLAGAAGKYLSLSYASFPLPTFNLTIQESSVTLVTGLQLPGPLGQLDIFGLSSRMVPMTFRVYLDLPELWSVAIDGGTTAVAISGVIRSTTRS